MPIPAIAMTIVSILGWIGIDLGVSWITKGEDVIVDYVQGLDFSGFVEGCWLQAFGFFLMTVLALWISFPRRSYRTTGKRSP